MRLALHSRPGVAAAADRRRDLDETRRLAYMVLAAQGTERYELAATVVTSLADHQRAADPDAAMRHVRTILSGYPGDMAGTEEWLRRRVEQITRELDSA